LIEKNISVFKKNKKIFKKKDIIDKITIFGILLLLKKFENKN